MALQTPLMTRRPAFARDLDRAARARAARVAAADGAAASGRSAGSPWLVTRLCLLGVTLGALKLGLLASVGEAAYAERAARLAEGNWAERTAAWVIHPDPVTVAVRDDLARLTRELSPL